MDDSAMNVLGSQMYKFFLLCLPAFFLFACKGEGDDQGSVMIENSGESQIQLTEIPAAKSGLHFKNEMNDEGKLNIFTWHFLYNGAGVATGDINNDGLQDIYFAGNMSADQLYLNKGDFTFENITASSGIADRHWSTGVTMADVNGDGWLDIYVCKNSSTGNREFNTNRLYINLRNGKFRESAAQYGVADVGFGVQSTFFDADQDGDLDMYLVNQPFDEFAMLVNDPAVVESYPRTDRMFFFENGRFVDKTQELGMENARYGLNVSIGDFDQNGWTDLYICNDYFHADHLYMNTEGKFQDALLTHTSHVSFYSMGSDVADVNNDGLPDLFTLDMAFDDHYKSKTNMGSMDPGRFWSLVDGGQHYQYMQNNLQLNLGAGHFAEVAQISGIAKTDWSYSALFADLDLDADKDLLVTNGVYRDLQNNDFNNFVKERYRGQVGPQNFKEVLSKLPSNPVSNLIYQNKGDLRFNKLHPSAGFDKPGFSHGMAYADFDNDGRLDIVINNLNATASLYRNTTDSDGHYLSVALKGQDKNTHGLGCELTIFHDGKRQTGTMQSTRGYFSASEPVLHFGLGPSTRIDSLVIYWNSRAMTILRDIDVDQKMTIDFQQVQKIPSRRSNFHLSDFKSSNIIAHQHSEIPFDDYREQVLLPYKLSQNGPFLARADVNGDKLEDLFIGGPAGSPGRLYLQNGGRYQLKQIAAFDADRAAEDQQAIFFDLEGDGDADLYVSSGSNEFQEGSEELTHRLYLNDGKGNFYRAVNGELPDIRTNGQVVCALDVDGDKDMDIFVGGRLVGGRYPVAADSRILINQEGKLVDKTAELAPFLEDFGLVTGACADDIDGDGDQDMLVVGEWMEPVLLINQGGQGFKEQVLSIGGTGLWWTVEKADVDGDGDTDFLLGNLGWNNKFGGSQGTKLEVYASDFDKNGDFDVVLANNKNGKTLPVRGRECSSQEMPFILDKFPSFDSYGKAVLTDIIPANLLEESTHKKLSTMSSIILLNNGNLNFSIAELPLLCQLGPVKAFETGDFNGDGQIDFFYAGNHFPTEVETARYDGLYPGLCLNEGDGNFTCKPISIDGTPMNMDVRDLEILQLSDGKKVLLFANNAGPFRAIEIP